MKKIFLLLILISFPLFAADPYQGTDDISVMMLALLIAAIAIIIIAVVTGFILMTIILFFVFALVAYGILSTSLIVGLHKKSFSKGFLTFLVSGSAIFGALAGGFGCWLINKFVHGFVGLTAMFSGAGLGLIAGLLFGFFAYYLIRKLIAYFKIKLNLA